MFAAVRVTVQYRRLIRASNVNAIPSHFHAIDLNP